MEDKDPKDMTKEEFFGERFDGIKGQEAFEKLLKEKHGYVPSAFTREDIGDIDLVWGNNLAGLCHIIKQREAKGINVKEFVAELGEVIEKGKLKSNSLGRSEIWYNKKEVIITPDFKGEKINWLVTAYKQRKE